MSLAVGILDSGLVCSASLPCPAEMGASIHINGTKSSVVDTVFVCRSTGKVPRRWISDSLEGVECLIRDEIDALDSAGLTVTQGDIRCIAHGHLTRFAIWNLRHDWDRAAPVLSRMYAFRNWFECFGGVEGVVNALDADFASASRRQDWMLGEMVKEENEIHDEISF